MKWKFLIIAFTINFLSETHAYERTISNRPAVGTANHNLAPDTLGKLAAVQFGIGNEDAHIVLIRGGKIHSFSRSSLQEAFNLVLRPGDIVAANEHAEALINWQDKNPEETISSMTAAKIIGNHFFEVLAEPMDRNKPGTGAKSSENGHIPPSSPILPPRPQSLMSKSPEVKTMPSKQPSFSNLLTPWSVVVFISILAVLRILWIVLQRRS